MRKVFKILRNVFAIIGVIAVLLYACIRVCKLQVSVKESVAGHRDNYIDSLKTSGAYAKDTLSFHIAAVPDSARAAEIRSYFQLDTLYDASASTWDKTLAIAKFVADNIPHGNQTVQPEKRNAIYLWEYTKTVEPAFNCRLHSIMMFELLSSVGLAATFVTCMPQDRYDNDCHVVNQVWLPELGKWAMIDSDSGGNYATDADGNVLSLQEIREHYISGEAINYHPGFGKAAGKNSWYYAYMAKNTYWFSCWENIRYDQEPISNNDNPGREIFLAPAGFETFNVYDTDLVTSDADKFWAEP